MECEFSADDFAAERAEADFAVLHGRERFGDHDDEAEFFLDLTAKGGFEGFAGLDFPAGEFPLAALGLIEGALAGEGAATGDHDGADDF